MKKPIIAVDIDDVLAGENETMRVFINEKYGLNLTPEDYLVEAPYRGYWEKVWGVTKEEGQKRFKEYIDSGIGERHAPLEGAIEAVTKLKKTYNLIIVSSRYDSLIDDTHKWLDTHFPNAFNSVEFVAVWSKDERVSKATICKEIGATYLIDDNLEHCNLAAEAGIKALLFGDYGWSKNAKLDRNVTSVKNWQEVLEYFNDKG